MLVVPNELDERNAATLVDRVEHHGRLTKNITLGYGYALAGQEIKLLVLRALAGVWDFQFLCLLNCQCISWLVLLLL